MMPESKMSYTPLAGRSLDGEFHRFDALLNILSWVWKAVVLCLLTLSTFLLVVIVFRQHPMTENPSLNYSRLLVLELWCDEILTFILAGPETQRESWIQYLWHSEYSNDHGEVTEEVDQAWNDVVPSHGIVAVDHKWAAERMLPASHNLPCDHSKGVYILDAYHQIHCLVSRMLLF